MTNLPTVAPLAPMMPRPEAADVRAMLQGLEPGWYTSASLLPRYNAWADQNGRSATGAKHLGEALGRMDFPRRKAHGNVRAYGVGV